MSERDAVIENDLRALDEALEAGAVTAADGAERELQELALALAAEAAQPRREFERALAERVRDGFPRRRRLPRVSRSRARLRRPSVAAAARPSASRTRLPRPSLPVLGGVASIAAALFVTVALVGDDGEGDRAALGPSEKTGSVPEVAAPKELRRGSGSPSGTARALPPELQDPAPGESRPRIERSASLTLAAPDGEIDAVAERIVAVTDRLRGFVLSSSVSSGDDGDGGRFELRVPADRLQVALRDLSALADVRSQSQQGQDVTREVVTAEDRLEAARAERRSLLRRLERAATDAEAEAIRRRLDLNAGEIRGLRAQVRDLRVRTGYATISLTLDERGDGGRSADDGLGGAFDDALGSLGDSAEIAVRVLGIALPLALIGVLGWGAARFAIRRRREAALS